jgi:ABC-type bacteriocin/lantibiotic exporter with double-glycine peptidase domain
MRSFAPWLVACVLAASLGDLHGQAGPGNGCSFTCGLNAAYIFLNKTGHHAPYADVMHDFQEQNPPDSLLAIKTVLRRHGCMTEGVKTDAGYFLTNKGPAIVFMQLTGTGINKENHFSLLVEASRQNGVELIDPVFDIRTPSIITWDSFSRSYQGTALILK